MPWIASLGLSLVAFGGYANTLPFVPFNLILVGAALTCIAAAWAVLREPERLNAVTPILLLWIAFVPGFLLADRTLPYAAEKTQQLLILVPITVIGALVTMTTQRAQAILASTFAVWGAVIVAAQIAYPDPELSEYGLLSIANSNYLSYGRAVGAAAVVLLALALRKTKYRFLYLAGGLAFLVATVMSGSRGPLIGAVLALVTVVLVSRLRPLLALVGVLLVWIATQLVDVAALIPERIQSFEDNSTSLRVMMFDAALDFAAAHPFGGGWGALAWELQFIGPDLPYPHNILIEVAAEGGVVAALGLVAVAVLAASRLVQHRSSPLAVAYLGLLVFFTANAMVSGDIVGNRGLWLVIGVGLAFPRIRRAGAEAQERRRVGVKNQKLSAPRDTAVRDLRSAN